MQDRHTLDFRSIANEFFHFAAHSFKVVIEVAQHIDSDPLAQFEESEEDVLPCQIVVIEALSFFFSQLDDLLGAIGEFVEHRAPTVLSA